MRKIGLIEKYKKYLPVTKDTPIITLFEGNTPLIYAGQLSKELELEVYFKYEGINPTGSFKDRGMTMAISKAVEQGSTAVMCASTGNTSASAAAYAARSGLICIVLIPGGKIGLGKLAQALIHGAYVIAVKGNFDESLDIAKILTTKLPVTLVNSLNPYRLEGQKTAAFEVCDFLGDSPDYLAIPVGNAGNITAYWMGFKEYFDAKIVRNLPRMIGFQAEGAAPIVRGYPVEKPETIATAIRIGNPARWSEAVKAAEESNGYIDMVSDDEIITAYKRIASTEGIFCEPASAASFAGLMKKTKEKKIKKGSKVVCVLTGHGLKDPDTAVSVGGRMIEMEANEKKIEEYIKNII